MDKPVDDFYPWLLPLVTQFSRRATEKKLAHAWVFYGPAGVGKGALVKQLSKQILASHDLNKQQWISAHTHPYCLFIEPAENGKIAIEVIRQLIDFLAKTPAAGL